jgi:UrcA family protein
MRITILSLMLTAAGVALTPAMAAAETQQRTTGVVYRDLDLSTDAGRAELDSRIERAAKQVCGMDESIVGTRIRSRDAYACYTQAKRQLDERFAGIVQATQLGG